MLEGGTAAITISELRKAGYDIDYLLDNNEIKQGKSLCGVPIISFADFCLKKEEYIVIVDNARYGDAFIDTLLSYGFPSARIYNSQPAIELTFGDIYFDLQELKRFEQEVFIDAGCFDGKDVMRYMQWSDAKDVKVIAVDALKDACKLTQKKLCGCENVQIHNCALGEKDGEINLYMNSSESYVVDDRVTENVKRVEMRSIDSILNGERVTFIKMDIEGNELNALKGAKKSICRWHPNLAISLYHKNEDLISIPLYIKELVPQYKFYLRHYSSWDSDLVLYAVC